VHPGFATVLVCCLLVISAGSYLIVCSSNAANEICKWAYEQVVSHSFMNSLCFLIALQTSKGAFDDQLQTELKEKLDNTNRAFLVCSSRPSNIICLFSLQTISTIRTISAVSALDRGVVELLDYV
jgi:hypothetical protein